MTTDTQLNNFASLLQAGSIAVSVPLLKYYSQLNITESELVVVLELQHILPKPPQAGVVAELASRMHQDESFIYQQLHTLTQKKLLTISQQLDNNHQQEDVYDLTPLYEKLAQIVATLPADSPKASQNQAKPPQDSAAARKSLFAKIEAELGVLTPINYQKIQDWLGVDHYSPAMIELALKEAVLNNARSFAYLDRVLLSWEQRGLTDEAKILAYQKNVRNKQIKTAAVKALPDDKAAVSLPDLNEKWS